MLQQKEISKILYRGLDAIDSNQPISISLLSHNGNPLITLTKDKESDDGNINFKILSLLTFQIFNNNQSEDQQDWNIINFKNHDIKSIIKKVENLEYFVILFYEFDNDGFAKLKIDSVVNALNEGFKGYKADET
ncbi:unnamed protein product [Candida verbasci]|uniref:Uncharacterized protein n=1 Tax=Candida verbasci TaxID=1227364 RepID=A0A9W4U146_9ASCO|nr:unnamed protein product [Candida verbasci]